MSKAVEPLPDAIESAPFRVHRAQGSLLNQLREALYAEHSERVIELMQLFFKR